MADDNGRRGTGHAGHVVMFGQPKAAISDLLGSARECHGVGQCIGGDAAFRDK
jgi:hypothetical protein